MKFLSAFIIMLMIATNLNAQNKKAVASKSKATPSKSAVAPAKQPTVEQKQLAEEASLINDKSTKVKIETDLGTMIVKLYDSTPLHRDNFVTLVKQGFYDSLIFHRVIAGFMIQGGDPTSKNAEPGVMLGSGGGDMQRIPAEFKPSIIHKRGALAAARDGNPEKASSACQFYIVQGKGLGDDELNMIESSRGRKYTPAQRATYKKSGGTPFLDQEYTVFGEVIEGMDVIDKVAAVQKGQADRPVSDIRMKMTVIE